MAERGDNQHTLPDFTKEEWIDKFLKLLPKPNSGNDERKDWEALFMEFVTATYTEYKGVRQFCNAKSVSYATLQGRGGAAFWNRARHHIQVEALAVNLMRAPDIVANKLKREQTVSYKILEALNHAINRILKAQAAEIDDPDDAVINPYEMASLKDMVESIKKITETNAVILNGGVNKMELKSINLHATLVEAMNMRDKQFGIEESE